MTHPIRHLMGNLIWTRFGTVWAVWRVEPPAYRNTGSAAGMELLDRTEALIRSLPTESLILSLCPQLDRDALLEEMHSAYPDRPRWAELCEAAADSLAPYELSRRTHWLAIPLPRLTLRERWAETARASWSQVAGSLGLPPLPVRAQEAEQTRGIAVQLRHTLPGLDLRPATPAEILWMFRRAPVRGLVEPTPTEGAVGGSRILGGRLRGPSLAGLEEIHLDEGGKAGKGLVSPFSHRYLAVESAAQPGDLSYQAFLAVAEVPAAFAFPGGELLDRLDDFGFGIDWAARLTVLPRDAAEAQNRRRSRELSEQAVQREDLAGGLPSDLEQAHRDLDDLRARLSASAS